MKRSATAVAAWLVLCGSAWAESPSEAAIVQDEAEAPAVPLLEVAAAPYIFLRTDIAHIEQSQMNSAQVTRDAHQRLASHNARKMGQAYVAYLALVAADEPSFAEAIDKETKNKKKRDQFLERLTLNPGSVRDLKGADKALAAMLEVSARDATRISTLGNQMIDDAYTLQSEGWARSKLKTNGMARVKGAKAWGESRAWPELSPRPAIRSKDGNMRPNLTADQNWKRDWSPQMQTPQADDKAATMATKALLMAALYSVDALDQKEMDSYGSDKSTDRCFVNAKLMFDQCIAATRTPYEEAFCIGTHGLNDVSDCVGWPASVDSES